MQNGKYLNEEKYQQNKEKIKRVGKILLIVGITTLVIGIILLILGFVGFGKTATSTVSNFDFDMKSTTSSIFGSFGLFVAGGFLTSIGFMVTIGGVVATVIAHQREIKAFTVQQTMPIAQEGVEAMAPTIGHAAQTISEGIAKGIENAKKESENK